MQQQAGKWLIFIGLAIPVTGVLIYFFGDRLRWLGPLPGAHPGGKGRATLVIPSIAGSALLWLIRSIKGG